jgi:hypothetical protein
MTQQIKEYFESELGSQLDTLYSTSDNRIFVKLSEAISHSKGHLDGDKYRLPDPEIRVWNKKEDKHFDSMGIEKSFQKLAYLINKDRMCIDGIDINEESEIVLLRDKVRRFFAGYDDNWGEGHA